MNCRFSDFDCLVDENPENVEVCKACASIRSAEVEEEMINIQKLQTLSTLAASLPYEEKDLQNKVNDKIKEMLREWLEQNESE
ncbi:hypothetical protein AKJ56_00675 [candidate division MSBL1 archaeon SCGC-AAA382N08]|uniref:Uncharacterized protein n=1 Tax=candidate division MSBL1 archaeon SCGC-AAA382N08 TaxID=1698285 RepID=A0A133VQC5_9EURY|nr:hypothetical protein AKJ56_00675 [candidate division MSBL1 archaeon SCGC-AAA382N08]